MVNLLRKIPGFRSGSLWKGAIASVFYLLCLLILLVFLFPVEPTKPSLDQTQNIIESAIPSAEVEPVDQMVVVARVVDGDTIKLESGEVVRYIGIDTPEIVDPRKPVQCYAQEASVKNKELVEGKEVRLEKDVSETDKYSRLLRYVWLGDTLVNELLVKEGYAQSSSYPPDVKYQDRFIQAQNEARENNLGLWGPVCTETSEVVNKSPAVSPQPIASPTPQVKALPATGGSYTCNCSKICAQMSSCDEAQYQLNVCGCTARDADHDGIACDADCQ